MPHAPAAKRTRGHALDATVTTVALPPYVESNGLAVQADGTRLMRKTVDTILALSRSGRHASVYRSESTSCFKDGMGLQCSLRDRFNCLCGLTVDEAGSIVVADPDNHAIRTVSLAGQIHTLAEVSLKPPISEVDR